MLLPYCIAEAGQASPPATGVRGSRVERLEHSRLACFFSRLEADFVPARQDALDFHGVVQQVFSQTAVIPFRLLSPAKDAQELTRHLRQNAAAYRRSLHRLRECVQMELNIFCDAPPAAAASGTEYLLDRREAARILQEAASATRERLTPLIEDFRQRESGKGLRCFLLLNRRRMGDLEGSMRGIPFHPDIQVVVSGPWPPAEFLDAQAQNLA